jgi:hypothetical protein
MEETSSHASPATLPQGLEKCSSGGWKQKLEKSRMVEERERERETEQQRQLNEYGICEK